MNNSNYSWIIQSTVMTGEFFTALMATVPVKPVNSRCYYNCILYQFGSGSEIFSEDWNGKSDPSRVIIHNNYWQFLYVFSIILCKKFIISAFCLLIKQKPKYFCTYHVINIQILHITICHCSQHLTMVQLIVWK